jgi:hypothetical protein
MFRLVIDTGWQPMPPRLASTAANVVIHVKNVQILHLAQTVALATIYRIDVIPASALTAFALVIRKWYYRICKLRFIQLFFFIKKGF